MTKETFKCTNRKNIGERKLWDLGNRDLYERGCINCRYVETHQGESWTQDWAHCEAPKKVRYGKTYSITPAVEEKLTEI